MKKTMKAVLTAVLAVASAVLLMLAGCKIGEKTFEEIKNDYSISSSVTYFANGGNYGSANNSVTVLYYKEGARVANLGTDGTEAIKIARESYVFNRWERVKLDQYGVPMFTDEGGTPIVVVTNENHEPLLKDEKLQFKRTADSEGYLNETDVLAVSSGEAVDFSQKITKDVRWYFCAAWLKDVHLEYRLADDGEQEEIQMSTTSGVKTYAPGELLREESFGTSTSINISKNDPMRRQGTHLTHQFLAVYADAECKTLATSIEKPAAGSENPVVYVKYIDKKWTGIVRESFDVDDMFKNLGAGKSYYVANDVTYTGTGVTPRATTAGEIGGNGCTIKNLKIVFESITQGSSVALLGNIEAAANIHDITFENITAVYSIRGSVDALYVFSLSAAEGAKLENVKFTGEIKMEITRGTSDMTVGNIPETGDVADKSSIVFGGAAKDSDFITAKGVDFEATTAVNIK